MNLMKSGKFSRFSVIIMSTLVFLGVFILAGSENMVYAESVQSLEALNAGVSKRIEGGKDELSGKSSVNEKKDNTVSGNAAEKAVGTEAIKNDKDLKDEEKDLKEGDGKDQTAEEGSLVMANVEDSLNVRAEAREDSEIVGKIYKDCAGELLEKGAAWSKIRSGSVEGWAKNEFLLFGEEAKKRAESAGKLTAVVNAETLRVRAEAHEEAEVYTLLAKGEEIRALEKGSDWVKVQVDSDTVGFVAGDYVTVENKLAEGETLKEITAREEAEAKKKEEAESAKKAEAEARKKEETKKAREEATAKLKTTKEAAVPSTTSDVVLLAALIQCEANYEPYDGKVAVGAVVMNRLRSGRYGSVYDVIYAPGQFGPAGSGKVAAVAAQGPSASNIQAAADALNGVNNIGAATHFRNLRSGYTGAVVGNHVFW